MRNLFLENSQKFYEKFMPKKIFRTVPENYIPKETSLKFYIFFLFFGENSRKFLNSFPGKFIPTKFYEVLIFFLIFQGKFSRIKKFCEGIIV